MKVVQKELINIKKYSIASKQIKGVNAVFFSSIGVNFNWQMKF
jgi:hypothetical protein